MASKSGHSTLPLSASIGFALQGLRLRLGRMALVLAGVSTAVAFMVTLLVLDQLYDRVPAAMRGEQSAGAAGAFRWMWIGVALLISTAGTFNAILMSVTERVKEIGTLKCLGARDRHVIQVFLFESVFLGAVAGLVGGAVGVGVAGVMFAAQAGARYLTVPAVVVDDEAGGFSVATGAWYRPKLGYAFRSDQTNKVVLSKTNKPPKVASSGGGDEAWKLLDRLTDRKGRQLIRPPTHPDTATSAMLQILPAAPFMVVEGSAGQASAAWRMSASVAGPYDVEVFIPEQAGLDAAARYRLVYPGGSREVSLDQSDPQNRGRWVALGQVDLDAGATLGVELHVEAGATAAADRVRVDNAFAAPLVHVLPWVIYGAGVSTLLSLLAAVVPVWIAAKVEPASAMRYDV